MRPCMPTALRSKNEWNKTSVQSSQNYFDSLEKSKEENLSFSDRHPVSHAFIYAIILYGGGLCLQLVLTHFGVK